MQVSLKQQFDEFGTQLIGFLEPRFQNIERRLDDCATKDDFDYFISLVDELLSRYDSDDQNNAARDAQLIRHEMWINHLAHKSNTRLDY